MDRVPMTRSESRGRRVRSAIVRVLADNGPLNAYQICQRLKEQGSRPTILYPMLGLARARFLRVVRVDKEARGPQPSVYYDLDLPGLAKLVSEADLGDPPDLFRCRRLEPTILPKYYNLLPHVFDLWPAFREAGLEGHMWNSFVWFCYSLADEWENPKTRPSDEKGLDDYRRTALAYFFVAEPIFQERLFVFHELKTDEGAMTCLEAFRRSTKLRPVMTGELSRMQRFYTDQTQRMGELAERTTKMVSRFESSAD
jgi:hypothetical protein